MNTYKGKIRQLDLDSMCGTLRLNHGGNMKIQFGANLIYSAKKAFVEDQEIVVTARQSHLFIAEKID